MGSTIINQTVEIMKELTKHEVCRLMAAINTEGMTNSEWTEIRLYAPMNAKRVFGTDDDSVMLEPAWYVAIYTDENDSDSFPMFQRLMEDVILDDEKCVLLDTNVLIFCVEKGEPKITIR